MTDPNGQRFRSGSLWLEGDLWEPTADPPWPVVLYNHGSGREVPDRSVIADVFTARGFAFFQPHRRGHGRSEGPNILALLEVARAVGEDEWARVLVKELEAQVSDQLAALDHLRGMPHVDPSRAVVMGSSFGGIQTLLAAEVEEFWAAIAFAPAAMTWAKAPPLRERLMLAARNARTPVMLLQAENDFDLTPTSALANEFERVGKPCRRVIYPAVGADHMDGHTFVTHPNIWMSDVFAFLEQHVGVARP